MAVRLLPESNMPDDDNSAAFEGDLISAPKDLAPTDTLVGAMNGLGHVSLWPER